MTYKLFSINSDKDINSFEEFKEYYKPRILWTLKKQGFNCKKIDGFYVGLTKIRVIINNKTFTIYNTAKTADWYITDIYVN